MTDSPDLFPEPAPRPRRLAPAVEGPAAEFPAAFAALDARARREVQAIAEAGGASIEAVLVELVAAYLRIARDAPEALPRNPMAPIRANARRRSET